MKIKLTKVTVQDKDKNGKPYISKTGKPYTRMSIQCQEYGMKWLSGFLNKSNEYWKEGDIVDVTVDEVFRDGKVYLNFSPLSRLDLLEARIIVLEAFIKGNGTPVVYDAPDEDIDAINAQIALNHEQ